MALAMKVAPLAALLAMMQGATALKQHALVPVARSSLDTGSLLEVAPSRDGSFCLKVATHSGWTGPGDFKLMVTAGGAEVVEFNGYGSGTVLEKCYEDPVTLIRVQGTSGNAWGGYIEVSADAGSTYSTLWCTGCKNRHDTSYLITDSDNSHNFGGGHGECLNGNVCNVVPAYCIRIITGAAFPSQGPMKVTVTTGPSTTVEADGSFALSETVLEKCYPAPPHVALQNENTDAWVGTVEVSADGGNSYGAMECLDCDPGTGTVGSTVAVDGNGDSAAYGMLACQDGKSCTLYTPGFVPELSVPEPAPSSVAAVTGDPHVSNMRGRRFDIHHVGAVTLLQIPRGAMANTTLLRLDGHTKNVGGLCDLHLYIDAVNISGKWTESKWAGHLSVKANSKAVSPSHPHHKQRYYFKGIHLVFSHAKTDTGVKYLNIRVSNLSKLGMAVGGLLGDDDASWASALPDACKEGHYTSRMISVLSASPDAGPSPTL